MENNKKLNIVVFPWLAFGHIIPFLELSKQLASRGHHIYFVSAPRNLERLPKIPPHLSPLITLVPLPLPRVENLPPNAEATTDVGFDVGTDLLKKAYDGLQEPMTKFLEGSSCPLDWIIHDFSCYWLPSIADKLNIKKVYFSICFARTLCLLSGWSTWPDFSSQPPWITFPDSTFYLLPHEARKVAHHVNNVTSSGVSDLFRFKACVDGCNLMAVRSCVEIEGEFIELAEKLLGKKTVFSLGLLPASIEETPEDDTWQLMNGWLDKQKDQSVVYVALGSEFELSQGQLNELALGLELSEEPFFWAFRKSRLSTLELPEGFEERTRGRGMVWTSWVPQLRVLSHKSIGGFLTHCGWSSIIEALQFGKPLIMLPLAFDHGLYARLFGAKKVGIEIPRNEEDGSFTRSSVAESLTLVLKDGGGKTLQDEAHKLSAFFADKSLHGQYIDEFSNYLCNHKP